MLQQPGRSSLAMCTRCCLRRADDGMRGGNGDHQLVSPSAALSSSDIWHAATVSVTQQLFGPFRARADLRWALHVPGGFSPVRRGIFTVTATMCTS